MGRPEQDFLKYRRNGDSRALARVFDRLAPELLLVALHLTSDHSRAEDLIQETFLRAMEVAEGFRPGSPLRPWLAGILANTAREARRTQARATEPVHPGPCATEDPADSAQSREFVERLGRVVESLPKTYRQVLILRLSKGMNAPEIAHTLGRRPATVHTQLNRGMDLLRKALPAGFAMPAFAGLVQGRGLAQVRQVVLERVGSSAGTAAGISLAVGPLFFLGKLMAPIALVGGLGYLAMAQMSPGAVAGTPVVRPENAAVTDPTATEPGGAQSQELPEDAPQVPPPPQESGVAFASSPTEAPAENPSTDPARGVLQAGPAVGGTDLVELAHIRGRCLAAETGLPLPGCTVSLRGFPQTGWVALHGEVDWQEPEPVVTGADGRFDIAFAALAPYRHALRIQAENRVLRSGSFQAFEPGQVEDVGDISFAPGYEVTGLVVDESGVAVAGVAVSLGNLPLPFQHGYMGRGLSGSSDTEGHFSLGDPIPAGTWPLSTSAKGTMLLGPDSVTVREGAGAESVHVVVKRMPWMSGTVLDENGAPASRVYLRVRSDVAGRIASTRTGQDGTFRLYSARDEQGGVRLEGGGGAGYEPLSDDRLYEWGSTDVNLVVRRALSFELLVVEQGTGKPIEDYAVISHTLAARSSGQTNPRLGGHHPEGKLVVGDIWRGVNKLVVLPVDPELMLSGTIEFEAYDTGVAPMVVELQRMPTHPVRVITEAGEPVEGSTVELIVKGSDEFDVNFPIERVREGQKYGSSDPSWYAPALLSEGKTDFHGLSFLPAPSGVLDLNLRVIGDTHLPASQANVFFPGDGSAVEIVVSSPGTLSGTVLVDGFDPSRMYVTVTHQDGRPLRMFDMRGPLGGRVEIEQDGSFILPGLQPGEYSLALGEGGKVLPGNVARVTVRSGETVEVTLDGTRYKPGTLHGRVFLNGVALSEGRVTVKGTNGQEHFAPDDEGRFEAEGLLPGEYRVVIAVGDFGNPGDPIVSEETVIIQPGQDVVEDFHFTWRKVRVRLLEADGKTPMAKVNVFVLSNAPGPGFGFNSKITDADGWLTLDPAPAGEVRFQVLGRGVLGPVLVPAGEREATFELKIGG